MQLIKLYKSIIKIGYDPDMPSLEKSRVMVLNILALITLVTPLPSALLFYFLGSPKYYETVFIMPFGFLALYFNHKKHYELARNVFLVACLLVFSFWCFENRRYGVEYTLVALACSMPVLLSNNLKSLLGFMSCLTAYLIYKYLDLTIPFVPIPGFNYEIVTDFMLFLSGGIVFFELLFYRDLVYTTTIN